MLHTDEIQRQIQLEMLNLTEKDLKLANPLTNRSKYDADNPHLHILRLMRNPDYFYFTCKHLLNVKLLPFQQVILKELWYRPFPMLVASRGAGKSFLLGLYAVLRALFIQGRKIVITGSGFRQAKTVFNYAETIWHNAPILRSLVAENNYSGPHHDADRWTMRLGDSTITALPLGDGTKIRGERAHDIIADEFASIPQETFETVVAGFGVVELQPVDKVERAAEIRVLKKIGAWSAEMDEANRRNRLGNQSIISGTAYYQFNHFAEYWKRWKTIISSKGDPDLLKEAFSGDIPDGFDWRDYSIIRLPVNLLPEGYMDERHVAKSKASVHSGIYLNEFGAVFSSDTNGFFKRSLVESCVTTNPIIVDDVPVQFRPVIRGDVNAKYVYGIDPASEHDKFSIVILQMCGTHRRIIYCWTTSRKEHQQRVNSDKDVEKDFYGYCARKIRELMRTFPCEHIALDSQGGGVAVREALHDPDKMGEDEKPIWEISPHHPLSDGKERPSDVLAGLHILEMCNFASAQYTSEANHGLRKDFEDKVCLFPSAGGDMSVAIAVSSEEDNIRGRRYDTLEDCYKEIEELKEELATIIHTQTPGSNRDRWDTPEVKTAGSRKGRLRKDRYSSLVMANYAARRLDRKLPPPVYEAYGGFVGQIKSVRGGPQYIAGPDWFVNPDGNKGGNSHVGRIVRH